MGDFELTTKKGNWWRDKITSGIIYRRGCWVYALSNIDSKGKYRNEECIDVSDIFSKSSHINFKRNITSNLMEGIRINQTSKDMLPADSMISRYIKQVFELRDSQ